jgi:hypothetical protein
MPVVPHDHASAPGEGSRLGRETTAAPEKKPIAFSVFSHDLNASSD